MKHFLPYILLSVLTACACSCTSEAETCVNRQEGKDIRIQFKMDVSSGGSSAGSRSRALSGDDTGDEVLIDAVDILAFVKGGDGLFRYSYAATDVSRGGTDSEVEIVATVKEYPAEQIFIVLCNSDDEVAAADIRTNEKMDEVLPRIVCGNAAAGEWPAKINGSPVFKPFPMYAKTTPQVISGANSEIGGFPLVRMVARADVTLKSGVSNFVLVNAQVFNRVTSGYVPYDFSAWDGASERVTSAGVPAGNHTGDPVLHPSVVYDAAYDYDVRGEILRSIYLFESGGLTEAGKTRGAAIVIGGKYGGSDVVTYYRIDIKTDATPAGYVSQDILRNHWYQIEIQSVAAPGAGTPIDAYLGAKPIDFTVEVTPWGEDYNISLPWVVKPSANCYIVAPGDKPFNIPIYGQAGQAIANGHLPATWLTSEMTLAAELLWSENSSPTAIVEGLKASNFPDVTKALLSVRPGNTEGNALVAVFDDKNKNGVRDTGEEIKWSWHIWAMNAGNQPQEVSGWMDRDLGMLRRTWVGTPGNKTGDPAIPLYYQWGRKEPFTQTATGAGDPGGRLWRSGTYTSVTTGTGNTLAMALQNPARQITDWRSPAGMYCWRTQSGEKGTYDPCPPGYRVPSTEEWGPLLSSGGTNFTTSGNHRVLIQTVTGLEWVLPIITDTWSHSHSRGSTDGCRFDVAVLLATGASGRIQYRADGGEETQRASLHPVRCIRHTP